MTAIFEVSGNRFVCIVACDSATVLAKPSPQDMKCTSFPNLALSTLLALMNFLVTFNAHLSLSDTLPIDSPSFLVFIPFCLVSHCLVLYYAIRFTFLTHGYSVGVFVSHRYHSISISAFFCVLIASSLLCAPGGNRLDQSRTSLVDFSREPVRPVYTLVYCLFVEIYIVRTFSLH